MEVVAAVALGLNPYIGMFVLAALAAATTHVPQGVLLGLAPAAVVGGIALLAGLAAPVDFVLGKFTRFAPAVRRASQTVAPVAGGLSATALTTSDLPLPLVAAGGAFTSWAVAALLTHWAAQASRSPAWVGLGHIPVLMGAATTSAIMVPLGLANPVIGYVLSALTISVLVGVGLTGLRAATTPVHATGASRLGGRAAARSR
jgi:hypothetical protein